MSGCHAHRRSPTPLDEEVELRAADLVVGAQALVRCAKQPTEAGQIPRPQRLDRVRDAGVLAHDVPASPPEHLVTQLATPPLELVRRDVARRPDPRVAPSEDPDGRLAGGAALVVRAVCERVRHPAVADENRDVGRDRNVHDGERAAVEVQRVPGAAAADANWSMIPQRAPTKRFSAAWQSRATDRVQASPRGRAARAPPPPRAPPTSSCPRRPGPRRSSAGPRRGAGARLARARARRRRRNCSSHAPAADRARRGSARRAVEVGRLERSSAVAARRGRDQTARSIAAGRTKPSL